VLQHTQCTDTPQQTGQVALDTETQDVDGEETQALSDWKSPRWALAPPAASPSKPVCTDETKIGISGGRSLTGAVTRRPPISLYTVVPGATCTTLGFGGCPSFKGHSLSRRAKS
jgi:hypothetical protein